MTISKQTTYFNDDFEDLWVQVNDVNNIELVGFECQSFTTAQLRALALMLEHVASMHEPGLFDEEGDEGDEGGGEQMAFDFGDEDTLPDGVYVIEGTAAEISELLRRQLM